MKFALQSMHPKGQPSSHLCLLYVSECKGSIDSRHGGTHGVWRAPNPYNANFREKDAQTKMAEWFKAVHLSYF